MYNKNNKDSRKHKIKFNLKNVINKICFIKDGYERQILR